MLGNLVLQATFSDILKKLGKLFLIIFWYNCYCWKGSLGAAVKLLPCDYDVMGSIPGNSLLQKCKERLHIYDLKWLDPSLDPAQA
jgi:hypothetical protein